MMRYLGGQYTGEDCNVRSILQHIRDALVNLNRAKIEKVMNKEDKHKYLFPFPC